MRPDRTIISHFVGRLPFPGLVGIPKRTESASNCMTPKPSHAAGPQLLWRRIGPHLVLFFGVAAAYCVWLGNEFIYDDHLLIGDQLPARDIGDLVQVFAERHWHNLPYYRPIARLTMVIQRTLHGEWPAPYHALNAAVVGAAAVLLLLLLRLPVFGVPMSLAFCTSALFGLHPIASCCAYPVCSGRETSLPAMFVLGAVYCYLRRGKAWYLLAVISLMLALGSKEQAVILPGLFVLADILRLSADHPGHDVRKWLARYAPIAVVIVGYFWIRWLLFGGESEHRLAVMHHPIGPLLSLLYAIQTTWTPFVELVYEPRWEVWASPWRWLVCAVSIGLLATLAARQLSELANVLAFWLGWIVLALLPTANILVQEAPFAERYGYLALAGVLGLVASVLSANWQMATVRQVSHGAALLLIVGAAMISIGRGRYFANDRAFLSQWLRTDPEAPQAHLSLGHVLLNEGDLAGAAAQYELALAVRPESPEGHYRLGTVRAQQGRHAEAIDHYRRTLARRPGDVRTLFRIAESSAASGQLTTAREHYRLVLAARPDMVEAHINLGALLADSGKYQEAIDHYQRALGLRPDMAVIHFNMGVAYERWGRTEEAMAEYRRAIQIDPGQLNAAHKLAWLLATHPTPTLRNGAEALTLARHCAEATGFQIFEVLCTLAAAHAEAGQFDEAVRWQQEALKKAPAEQQSKARGVLEQYRRGKPLRMTD